MKGRYGRKRAVRGNLNISVSWQEFAGVCRREFAGGKVRAPPGNH
jgi:hypothetical protein